MNEKNLKFSKNSNLSQKDLGFILKNLLNGFSHFESIFDDQGEFVDCKFINVNDSFEHITGMKRADVIGKTLLQVWPGISSEWIKKLAEVAMNMKEQDFELFHDPSNKTYHCRVCRSPSTREHFFMIFDDVSAYKQTEEAHRQSKNRYHLLFDLMDQGVAINEAVMDEQGRVVDYLILAVNEAFSKHAPYKREEAVGGLATEIYKMSPQFINSWWQEHVQQTKAVHTEFYHEPSQTWHSITTTPVEGKRFITIFSNITEHKQAEKEREKLQAQLFQSQKMESVGTLAGGIAHDFNNMLSVILGFAELGLSKMNESDPVYEDLKQIMHAAQRSAEITQQLLAFARKQAIAPKALDLNESVSSMLKMLQRLIGKNIEIVWQPGADLWQIQMDPTQLTQILTNLFVNAQDAITGPGRISIETAKAHFDERDQRKNTDIIAGDFVLLAVSDTGCGMDQMTLSKAFEPFFTTKKVGKGTGLGLSTVYGIIKQNGGFIDISSQPGKGSRISIYFPGYQTDIRVEESNI